MYTRILIIYWVCDSSPCQCRLASGYVRDYLIIFLHGLGEAKRSAWLIIMFNFARKPWTYQVYWSSFQASSLAQLTYIKITQKNYHIFNTVLWKLRYNPTQMSSKMGNQRKIKSVPSKYCTSKFAKTAVKIKNLYTLKGTACYDCPWSPEFEMMRGGRKWER